MRKIKFRAWYEKEKRFLSWDELQDGTESLQTYFNNKLSDVSPLMQYTGIKDKNGKEIYEGDIVECFNNGNSYVSFKGGVFGLISDYGFIPFSDVHGKMRVIGNIFQDGDLLRDS